MPNPVIAEMGRKGAAVSWKNTTDRTARTAPARAALLQRFLDQANGDPELAAQLRREHYAEMGRRRHRKPTEGVA